MNEELIGGYKVHPVASWFPLLQGTEFQAFTASIREEGQKHPIVIHNGLILDGRNRLRACLELGIEPKLTEYAASDDDGAARFICASNLHRRNLSVDQKVMIVTIANQWIKDDNHRRQIEAGKEFGRGCPRKLPRESEEAINKRKLLTRR